MKPEVEKIYVPYYICDTAVQAIEQAGITVKRYSLSEKLEPAADIVVEGNSEGVLMINYFGLKDAFIRESAQKYKHMIIDCTQAFFFEPVMQDEVTNIFSCRKFIGVPDGAYLVGKNTRAKELKAGSSWENYSFVCKAHDVGTNEAYSGSLENEERLGQRKEGMSELTRKVLQGIDYSFIAKKREENFRKMHELLENINRLKLKSGEGIPYCYPLWAPRGTGRRLKEKLLKEHIYIPTLWKECAEVCGEGSLEVEWMNDLICLPVDQRYTAEDIEFLAETVIKLLGE